MSFPVPAIRSDWFSPMVIKELRQGLHSRLFITFYLLLQGLLVFSILLLPNAQDAGDGLFWFTVTVTLVVALPLRGLVAVSVELRARTMELLSLTRLTALRILLGKWSALFLQALLCAVAILPYLFVRYLLGGQEVIREAVMLASVLLLSGLCMALTVSFSALANWWGRAALTGIAFTMLWSTYHRAIESLTSITWMYGAVFLFVTGLLFIGISLTFGASLIALASENHTLRLRLLALLYCVAVPPVGLLTGFLLEAAVTSLAVLILVSLSSLLVPQHAMGRQLRPFRQLGFLDRWAAFLFSPGWASGLCFTLVLCGLLAAGMTLFHPLFPAINLFDALFYLAVLLGTLLVPLAAILCFQSPDAARLLPFIWAQMTMLFAFYFFSLVEQALESGTHWLGPIDFLSLLPTATLMLLLNNNLAPDEHLRFCLVNLAVTALAALFLLGRARPELRDLETQLRQLRATS